MGLFSWMDAKVQKMHAWDISLVKLSTAAAVLLIAKYWPVLISFAWYWYVIVFVLAAISPLYAMFFKE